MEQLFDVIVIGTGVSGKAAAYECRQARLTTAIIDNRAFGGTCELRGCDPKKVLVGAMEAIDAMNRYSEKNIFSGDIKINWHELMNFKKTFTDPVSEHTEASLQEAGIHTIHGKATFIEKNKLMVNDTVLEGKHIIIATGALPQPLPYPGNEFIHDSEYFLQMDALPKHIVFIGGGYISFEFAHIAKLAGAKVTIINRSERLLKNFDKDLVSKLMTYSQSIGIDIRLNTDIKKIEKENDRYTLVTIDNEIITCDLIIHGAGRIPNIADLDLEKAEIEATPKGITINSFMQSKTNASVYAVGDAAQFSLPLTPLAGKEGAIAAKNIISGNSIQADFKVVPSTVFTIPSLAMVGIREEEAIEKEIDYEVHLGDSTSWYTSHRINEKISAYKVIVDKKSGLILGAHILGHGAEEIINIFTVAIHEGISASILKELVYAYPTKSSDIAYFV